MIGRAASTNVNEARWKEHSTFVSTHQCLWIAGSRFFHQTSELSRRCGFKEIVSGGPSMKKPAEGPDGTIDVEIAGDGCDGSDKTYGSSEGERGLCDGL